MKCAPPGSDGAVTAKQINRDGVMTVAVGGHLRLFSSQEKTATTKPYAGPHLLRSSSEQDRCSMCSCSFFAALGLCTRHKKVPPPHPAGLCQQGHPRPLPVRVS